MKQSVILISSALCFLLHSAQAQKKYTPTIQSCDCQFKMDSAYAAIVPEQIRSQLFFQNRIDSSFKTECGYLIVPENRKKASSKMIKLPFIVLKSKNPDKKQDPVLFTSGGPGNSSLGWANGMTKSSVILDRDCIAFEQRGTRFAIPHLRTFDLDSAVRVSYRKNLPKDSMWIEGVKRYKKSLEKRGIDLAGYNSDETVSDMEDLLTVLHIDSVNLMGGSYSGGLMLALLQKDPKRVRSLVLDSPLPMFTHIDEDEPANFNTALNTLFQYAERDSSDKERYGNLKERFQGYFTAITNQVFYLPYAEKGTSDTLQIQYTKNELLDAIEGRMLNFTTLKDIPFVITDIINGNHAAYVTPRLDKIFNANPAPDGMRITVYCADQSTYHSQEIVHQLYKLYPYMEGYHINDVWKEVCDCWKVPPVHATTKQPFYSPKPVLIADGEMDPACQPLYMLEIKHYMPHAQTFLFRSRTHGVGGKDFYEMTQSFLDNPYATIKVKSQGVVAY